MTPAGSGAGLGHDMQRNKTQEVSGLTTTDYQHMQAGHASHPLCNSLAAAARPRSERGAAAVAGLASLRCCPYAEFAEAFQVEHVREQLHSKWGGKDGGHLQLLGCSRVHRLTSQQQGCATGPCALDAATAPVAARLRSGARRPCWAFTASLPSRQLHAGWQPPAQPSQWPGHPLPGSR